ncbi:MAG: hypothetical protein L0221_03950 [Chloroflexi bacterium]|nr:hypothetical protein [Chloroflexota bacterium]
MDADAGVVEGIEEAGVGPRDDPHPRLLDEGQQARAQLVAPVALFDRRRVVLGRPLDPSGVGRLEAGRDAGSSVATIVWSTMAIV